eukprot:CAMPEP_0116570096 /NCGR_PEP_ID=MMETSP0397-20121206/16734_1 /TAXON_ID=216820 /ORGANISM="Cyclophora tenuis, Strain ECT3854" /LENGTH=149 /DNA_ID=CAMNT_0004097883 /DNA_START=257 /DNA_END=706 /DNA_ORIENTATION=-
MAVDPEEITTVECSPKDHAGKGGGSQDNTNSSLDDVLALYNSILEQRMSHAITSFEQTSIRRCTSPDSVNDFQSRLANEQMDRLRTIQCFSYHSKSEQQQQPPPPCDAGKGMIMAATKRFPKRVKKRKRDDDPKSDSYITRRIEDPKKK